MFYLLNKHEAEVIDAIFIVFSENVTQVYRYHIFSTDNWLHKSSLDLALY